MFENFVIVLLSIGQYQYDFNWSSSRFVKHRAANAFTSHFSYGKQKMKKFRAQNSVIHEYMLWFFWNWISSHEIWLVSVPFLLAGKRCDLESQSDCTDHQWFQNGVLKTFNILIHLNFFRFSISKNPSKVLVSPDKILSLAFYKVEAWQGYSFCYIYNIECKISTNLCSLCVRLFSKYNVLKLALPLVASSNIFKQL